jgi:hypothetical protein
MAEGKCGAICRAGGSAEMSDDEVMLDNSAMENHLEYLSRRRLNDQLDRHHRGSGSFKWFKSRRALLWRHPSEQKQKTNGVMR